MFISPPDQKSAYLEMEGLIDVKITNGDHNHIVHRSAIAFRQRELLSANGRTVLDRAFDLERIMNDVDAFVADYSRGNCKWGNLVANHHFRSNLKEDREEDRPSTKACFK